MTSEPTEFARDHLVVISAPNGARRTREDHPELPITPAQLADEAVALRDAGVSVLHLHVRDRNQQHSLDPEHYRVAMDAIRRSVGNELVIQVTSEAVGKYDRFEQMDMVRQLRPEAVSLALRELCPDEQAISAAADFYEFLRKEQIWPQHILYDQEDVRRFGRLHTQGIFGEDHPWCLLVLGNYAQRREGSLSELELLLASTEYSELHWAVCCFGASEHHAMSATYQRGGHTRLGFENNLVRHNGLPASSNSELIIDFLDSIDHSRKPITADALRAFLPAR